MKFDPSKVDYIKNKDESYSYRVPTDEDKKTEKTRKDRTERQKNQSYT